MYKNYFTIALRNMMRHKLYSLINIGGLAIGLAACILIFLFVKDEVSHDDWGLETDQLYKLESALKQNEGNFPFSATTPGRFRDSLAENYQSEFLSVARLFRDDHVLKLGTDVFTEAFWFADPQIFELFDIEMISGNREDVFRDNRSIIINQSMATKYFGTKDPIGQTLDPDGTDYAFKIVGVMKDLPENTHLTFEFLALFDPEQYIDMPWIATWWLNSSVHTYVKLAPGASPEAIERSFPAFIDANVISREQTDLDDPSKVFRMRMMPVSDIHLYSTGLFQMKPGGDINVVYAFSVIALLILFIASINFINLSTARASMRAREIALRKVVGASRTQLIIQFLGEAGLMVLLALILALSIVEISLPWFSGFVAKILALDYGSDPATSMVLVGLLVVVGIGAGILPAIQITRFRPATVLRVNNSSASAGSSLRVILITVQFAISIGLIATTIIVYSQTEYASNKDLGFETKNRIMLGKMAYSTIKPVSRTIKNEIERLSGVIDTAFSGRDIPLRNFWQVPIDIQGLSNDKSHTMELVPGGPNLLNFLDVELIAGRIFSEEFRADGASPEDASSEMQQFNVVINRSAVGNLNLGSPDEALGESFGYMDFDGNPVTMTIVGVVEDMHIRSLKDEVEPLALHVNENDLTMLNIHLSEENQTETLAAIRMIWKKHVPSFPIELSYIDERFERLYVADVQRGLMFGYFSIFAIIVSSLGLFGLSAFTAEQRTKEIGVRKVYGADNLSIIRLLVWQFSKPVLLANIIAWPVAWYIMQDWLAGYAYRIDLTLLPFAMAGIVALIIAWSTVSLHAWRVARTNPINALRYE